MASPSTQSQPVLPSNCEMNAPAPAIMSISKPRRVSIESNLFEGGGTRCVVDCTGASNCVLSDFISSSVSLGPSDRIHRNEGNRFDGRWSIELKLTIILLLTH